MKFLQIIGSADTSDEDIDDDDFVPNSVSNDDTDNDLDLSQSMFKVLLVY